MTNAVFTNIYIGTHQIVCLRRKNAAESVNKCRKTEREVDFYFDRVIILIVLPVILILFLLININNLVIIISNNEKNYRHIIVVLIITKLLFLLLILFHNKSSTSPLFSSCRQLCDDLFLLK